MGPLRPHRASEGSAEIPSSSVLNAHPLLILPPSKHELIELVLHILLEEGASLIFVQRERHNCGRTHSNTRIGASASIPGRKIGKSSLQSGVQITSS